MAKMKDYVDKEHAVGMLEYTERHMKEINKRLDEIGAPSHDNVGVQYSILHRVNLVCSALLNKTSSAEELQKEFARVKFPVQFRDIDPEEVIEFIYSEGDFNG